MLQTEEAVLECSQQAQKTEAAVPALRELDRQESADWVASRGDYKIYCQDFFDLPEELTNWLRTEPPKWK